MYMFGFVTANLKELDKSQQQRYSAVYCGICRQLRSSAGQISRLSLSYDMTFLALLLMSLYEPEESGGDRACALHPCRKSGWTDNTYIRYAADMNVMLAYYNCLDDWSDDHSLSAKLMAGHFLYYCEDISRRYGRQCQAIESCLAELDALEKAGCDNPDEPAGCFGHLLGELLVYEEDLWAPTLREMGVALGRFIYLADAAVDYKKDARRHKYNPYVAMHTGVDWPRWEEHLVLAMGRCTEYFESLPLVQDKPILDNILYSGVWTNFGRLKKEVSEQHD